jgi:molybdopterin-guanine dinucleotide biosynthesis protein A
MRGGSRPDREARSAFQSRPYDAAMNSTPHIAGFVLAGGRSSRMGRDKALLEIGGVPLLVRTARLVESVAGTVTVIAGVTSNTSATANADVSVDASTAVDANASANAYQSLGLRLIGDDWPGAGPLGGIATALRESSAVWSLVVACDLPYLTREWLDYLCARAFASEADAVMAINAGGTEPLCAMYHKRSEAVIRLVLERGTRKVKDGIKSIRVGTIQPSEWKAFDSEGLLFKNMNSPVDYEEARARLGAVS